MLCRALPRLPGQNRVCASFPTSLKVSYLTPLLLKTQHWLYTFACYSFLCLCLYHYTLSVQPADSSSHSVRCIDETIWQWRNNDVPLRRIFWGMRKGGRNDCARKSVKLIWRNSTRYCSSGLRWSAWVCLSFLLSFNPQMTLSSLSSLISREDGKLIYTRGPPAVCWISCTHAPLKTFSSHM